MTYGIKEFMMKSVLHIISLWAICLACASCSQEDISQPVSIDGDGQVKILYKIAGTSLSRATEDGWGDEDNNGTDEWHENIINHIDLFVFNSNNKTLFKHIASSGNLNVDAKSVQTFTQNELTYNDVITGNYIYYMVANCEFDDNIVEGTFTLEDLKKKITPKLTFNDKQTSFAMDGMIENTPSPTDNTITLSFKLERAAAKIRLSVFGVNDESIIDECSFRLHNYVSDGTYVLTESEKYCINTSQLHHDMPQYQDWNSTLKYHDTEENIDKAIFYSYPNDWFDESLLNEDGTFIAEDGDTYAKDDLIDEARQTYIVVEYKKNTYKVPVNFSIANDNDRTFANDEEEIAYIKEIRDKYYRIKRNHIYDIKATIDVEANKIEVEHKILVNAWNEKENMDVIFGDESNESNESN